MRVLIVEDDALIADELAHLVRNTGHDVVGVAYSSVEARAAAERSAPEAALVDVELADGMTGLALADELERRFATRVAYLTGNVDQLPDGAERLEKPYFDAAVARLLSRLRASAPRA